MSLPEGQYLRAALSSSDLTTAVAVPFVTADNQSYVPAAGERVIITHISTNNGATASVISFFQDNNGDGNIDAGELRYAVSLPISGTDGGVLFNDGIRNQKMPATLTNGLVKVKASAASVGTTIIVLALVVQS